MSFAHRTPGALVHNIRKDFQAQSSIMKQKTMRASASCVQALIMAGGRGERLYPLTVSRPKPLVSFGGAFRILDFTLSNCLHSGLRKVSLLTQYKRHEVGDYIRQRWSEFWREHTGQPIVCHSPNDGCQYRGTADAVFQNIDSGPHGREESVLILSGDHVYHMDYRALLQSHIETGADLTMATVEHRTADATQFGVVEVDMQNRVIGFDEKPSNPRSMPSRPLAALVSMGVYVFRKQFLIETITNNCSASTGWDFGSDVIPRLIHSARVHAYDFRNEVSDTPHYWRDIGTIDSYYEASMDLVWPDIRFDPYARANGSMYRAQTWTPPDAILSPHCDVRSSVLSPGVCIKDQSSIESSVLMRNVSVGKGSRIQRAIVEEGVNIPAGTRIGFDAEEDRRRYFVTATGIVVVTRQAYQCPPSPHISDSSSRCYAGAVIS